MGELWTDENGEVWISFVLDEKQHADLFHAWRHHLLYLLSIQLKRKVRAAWRRGENVRVRI